MGRGQKSLLVIVTTGMRYVQGGKRRKEKCEDNTRDEQQRKKECTETYVYVNFQKQCTSRGPAVRRWCARATRPPYRGNPPYSCQVMSATPQWRPCDFDRHISGYRLIWGYRLIGGPLLQIVPQHRGAVRKGLGSQLTGDRHAPKKRLVSSHDFVLLLLMQAKGAALSGRHSPPPTLA